MSLYKQFKTDSKAEAENGITLDYGEGGKFHVRRAGGANKRFGEVLTAKLKPHRRKIDLGVMDNDVATRLLAETYAETVVTGWDDVPGPDGAFMPFSKQNVVKLLTDLPEFFKTFQDDCANVSNFRAEEVAADAEKLKND